MIEYKALIVEDWLDPRYDVKDVMRIYQKFNLITPAPKWGRVPLACTCKVCFPNCMCQCTLLLASLFDPEIRVPAHYIAATPSLRKACRGIKGTAGYKRRKLIEAAECDEKEVSSKVGYMTGTKRALRRHATWSCRSLRARHRRTAATFRYLSDMTPLLVH